MVELVDTTDLKSVDPKGRAGSSPAPGTKREIAAMRSPVYWFFYPERVTLVIRIGCQIHLRPGASHSRLLCRLR